GQRIHRLARQNRHVPKLPHRVIIWGLLKEEQHRVIGKALWVRGRIWAETGRNFRVIGEARSSIIPGSCKFREGAFVYPLYDSDAVLPQTVE
ncbi:MAG TPA: hypothetical protein VKA69_10965, partial [Desulfobacteria bacterium]|nr:hypothetical protein [Desulfobacteria bacterium]